MAKKIDPIEFVPAGSKLTLSQDMAAKFPEYIIAAAQLAQKSTKCWASVALAQWAEESGYGKSMPKDSNNPFGIKAAAGQPSVTSLTREWVREPSPPHFVTISAQFRKFDNVADAFIAHGQLMTDPKGSFQHFLPMIADPYRWVRAFAGVYATDPNYANLITTLMGQWDLTQFDKASHT